VGRTPHNFKICVASTMVIASELLSSQFKSPVWTSLIVDVEIVKNIYFTKITKKIESFFKNISC
jgi:hypothetical protein